MTQQRREHHPTNLPKTKGTGLQDNQAEQQTQGEVEQQLVAIETAQQQLQQTRDAANKEIASINSELDGLLSQNPEGFVIRFIQTIGE